MSDFPWLSVLVALPLVGAFVVPSLRGATAKQTGLGFSLATLVLSVLVAAQYELDGGMQLTETYEWIPAFGVHFALGVDGLGLLMVLLTTLLVPIVLLAMPFHGNNIDTLRQLRAGGFAGTVAVVAQYDDDLRQAERAGAAVGFQLYDGAGAELADRAAVAAGLDVSGPTADARRGPDRPSGP